MCTLVIGRDVLVPGTLWLAANRDEEQQRPSDPPRVLHPDPRVLGGRDRVAGGTWLALREGGIAIAMLNRRPDPARRVAPAAEGLRSRGLLTLDLAAHPALSHDPDQALGLAERLAAAARYAPFSLVYATATGGWLLTQEGQGPLRVTVIESGWHVVTHADLDDPAEPRTAWLLGELSAWRPASAEEIERGLIDRLREHGAGGDAPHPPVCIHDGRMVTVSSSLVHLDRGRARYLHGEGRPCESAMRDVAADPAPGVGQRSGTPR